MSDELAQDETEAADYDLSTMRSDFDIEDQYQNTIPSSRGPSSNVVFDVSEEHAEARRE